MTILLRRAALAGAACAAALAGMSAAHASAVVLSVGARASF